MGSNPTATARSEHEIGLSAPPPGSQPGAAFLVLSHLLSQLLMVTSVCWAPLSQYDALNQLRAVLPSAGCCAAAGGHYEVHWNVRYVDQPLGGRVQGGTDDGGNPIVYENLCSKSVAVCLGRRLCPASVTWRPRRQPRFESLCCPRMTPAVVASFSVVGSLPAGARNRRVAQRSSGRHGWQSWRPSSMDGPDAASSRSAVTSNAACCSSRLSRSSVARLSDCE